jgi:CBS domain containing-hemolysin-like protein
MREHHMAIVVGECGGTAGVATIEDMLERLGGSRTGDRIEPQIVRLSRPRPCSTARVDIDELNEMFRTNIKARVRINQRLCLYLLGRMPNVGDRLSCGPAPNVLAVDGHRIRRPRHGRAGQPRTRTSPPRGQR